MVVKCGNGDITEQFSGARRLIATIDMRSKYPIEALKRLLIFP